MRVLSVVGLFVLLSASVSFGDESKEGKSKSSPVMSSLYTRLGGRKAISAVVDDFVPRAAANPKVNFFRDGRYKGLNVDNLKKHLVDFIASATGGNEKYSGREMHIAHGGMNITEAEFNALAGDLSASLDKMKVPAKEKAELMAIAGSTKSSIVGK